MTTITKMTTGDMADESKPGTQRVSLTTVAQEASRQLRDMAVSRDVRVVVAPDLPEVTVDVGRLELILTNLCRTRSSIPIRPSPIGLSKCCPCRAGVRFRLPGSR